VALREDVKAAAEQQRAVIANTAVALERDSPTLDVFGSIALNGKDTSLGTATGQAFSFSHPTEAIGLRFSAPIDFAVLKNTRAGWSREQAGAELNYQRKIFEQDQSWQDLTQRLIQAKRRLQLARSVEMVQKNKMENERSRYKTGRTTTFQVLTFEQDFYSSQISRIRAQSDVLTLISQMKLFGDAS
jgi:outer membrane protein TolC